MDRKTEEVVGRVLRHLLGEIKSLYSEHYEEDASRALQLAQAFNLIATAIGEKNTVAALDRVCG